MTVSATPPRLQLRTPPHPRLPEKARARPSAPERPAPSASPSPPRARQTNPWIRFRRDPKATLWPRPAAAFARFRLRVEAVLRHVFWRQREGSAGKAPRGHARSRQRIGGVDSRAVSCRCWGARPCKPRAAGLSGAPREHNGRELCTLDFRLLNRLFGSRLFHGEDKQASTASATTARCLKLHLLGVRRDRAG